MRDKAVAVEVEQSDVVAMQVEIASLARLQSQEAAFSAVQTCTARFSPRKRKPYDNDCDGYSTLLMPVRIRTNL